MYEAYAYNHKYISHDISHDRHTNKHNTYNYKINNKNRHTKYDQQNTLYRHLRNRTLITVVGILLIVIGIAILLFGKSSNTPDVEASTIKEKQFTSIQVQPGDTLWSLAEEYGEPYKDYSVFIDEVKSINQLHGDHITAGGYLFIPVYR